MTPSDLHLVSKCVDEKLSDLSARLRARAEDWRLDMSENRNNWADLLDAIADDIEQCRTSSTSSTDGDPSQQPSTKSET